MTRDSHSHAQPPRRNGTSAMRSRSRYDGPDVDDRQHGYENPTSAGMMGFILCMVSLGLLFVVAVLWYAMNAEDEQLQVPERRRMMLYWFMILDIVSFFVALAGTIFAMRGLTPTNPLYRGWSMAALIVGIGEILLTAFAALILTCFVLIAEIHRAGG